MCAELEEARLEAPEEEKDLVGPSLRFGLEW